MPLEDPATVVSAPPERVVSVAVVVPLVAETRYVVGFEYPLIEPVPPYTPEITTGCPTFKVWPLSVKETWPATPVVAKADKANGMSAWAIASAASARRLI